MAPQTRPTEAPVIDALFERGDRYGYFQAIRLLRMRARAAGASPDAVRVRPRLGLAFPETDIDSIERGEPLAPSPADGGAPVDDAQAPTADAPRESPVRITANFFGLYGVASPLPTFYTEDLLAEAREGRHATRDFLDIFHHALYPLLYLAWRKPRLQLRVVEESDARALDYLYAFVGLERRGLRRDAPLGMGDLLRYAGLISQRPRSALGLQTLLDDAFSPADVRVDSCTEAMTPIPADQRIQLGRQAHQLGEDTHLGSLISDRMNHIEVHLDALPAPLFHQLLPGEREYERLRFLVRFYLVDPLGVTIGMRLRRGEAQPARLAGPRWRRLGLDTWLALGADQSPQPVRFAL